MFRFSTWATLRPIEYCESLADEHLDATTPGTYGTIRETLRHIVDAEEGYFSILTRDRFPSKAAAESFVRNDRLPDGPVPLHELAERIRRMGPHWEAMAHDADLAVRDVTYTDGWHLPGAVIMALNINHAVDQLRQDKSILCARIIQLTGIEDFVTHIMTE